MEGMSKATILVVDDEDAVRGMIEDALRIAGHEPVAVANAKLALQRLKSRDIDLVITDVVMPQMDGFELVSHLRKSGDNVPVIFLSARNQKFDINEGFKLGADDYISKPFGIEELTLRVSAILRRTLSKVENMTLDCGPVKLSIETHQVWVEDKEVQLSPTEFRLLQFLLEHQGKALSKFKLLDEVWGMGFAENATVLDTYISYLRKKIHTTNFSGIKTVRGIGFKIEA